MSREADLTLCAEGEDYTRRLRGRPARFQETPQLLPMARGGGISLLPSVQLYAAVQPSRVPGVFDLAIIRNSFIDAAVFSDTSAPAVPRRLRSPHRERSYSELLRGQTPPVPG